MYKCSLSLLVECPVGSLFVLQCQREDTGEICLNIATALYSVSILCIFVMCMAMYLCRKHGRRNRFVPANCPTVSSFTDSSSMSGAATDLSTSNESNEESNNGGMCIVSGWI